MAAEAKNELDKRILDQLYEAYGNLQNITCALLILADGFRDREGQDAVQVLDAVQYYLQHVVEDFSKPISEYDLKLLHAG